MNQQFNLKKDGAVMPIAHASLILFVRLRNPFSSYFRPRCRTLKMFPPRNRTQFVDAMTSCSVSYAAS